MASRGHFTKEGLLSGRGSFPITATAEQGSLGAQRLPGVPGYMMGIAQFWILTFFLARQQREALVDHTGRPSLQSFKMFVQGDLWEGITLPCQGIRTWTLPRGLYLAAPPPKGLRPASQGASPREETLYPPQPPRGVSVPFCFPPFIQLAREGTSVCALINFYVAIYFIYGCPFVLSTFLADFCVKVNCAKFTAKSGRCVCVCVRPPSVLLG